MTSAKRLARACAPVLTLACLIMAAPAAARTTTRVLRPLSERGDVLVFDVSALRGSRIHRAALRVGDRERRLRAQRVQAALVRGRLRLHRPPPRRSHGTAAAELAVVVSWCAGSRSRYREAVLATPGLVSYLRLDEAAGRTACDSAGARSGRYVGAVGLGRAGAIAGDPDGAVALDGASGAVRVRSAPALNPAARLSLEAWIRPQRLTGRRTIVSKAGQYLLGLRGDRLVFRLGPAVASSPPGAIAAAIWQHVVAVYDGVAMRLYVDGAQVSARPRAGAVRRTAHALYAGATGGGRDVFAGLLDEVALYRAALEPATIARHHTLGRAATQLPDGAPPTPAPAAEATPTPTETPAPTPTPAPAGEASVTCGLGTFTAGHWPTACWRPYADFSPFNRPLPPSPTVLPNSTEMVQRILGMGPIADMVAAPDTALDWYHPIYYNSAADPAYTVHCVMYACEIEGLEVRIPPQARPAAGGDGHMTVVDQSSGWEWDFWQVQDRPAGGGTLNVSHGGRTLIAGDGLGSDANAGQWGLLGGIIRAPEMQAGRIDHALFMVVGCTHSGYVYPAEGEAGQCSDQTNAPVDGQLLQLDMSDSQIDALAVPAWKKTILRALAHYGAYIGDTGGNEAFSLQFESGSTYTSFGYTDPMVTFAAEQASGVTSVDGAWHFDLASGVDWADHLRVLDPCVARGTCEGPRSAGSARTSTQRPRTRRAGGS